MHTVYLASVFLHVLAAMVWVGGQIFLAAVVIPLKNVEVTRAVARRFRTVGWIALATLALTGVYNVVHRGYDVADLFNGNAYAGDWGHRLLIKLLLVLCVLAMTPLHDRLGAKSRKAAMATGQVAFAFSLAIVGVAITLVR